MSVKDFFNKVSDFFNSEGSLGGIQDRLKTGSVRKQESSVSAPKDIASASEIVLPNGTVDLEKEWQSWADPYGYEGTYNDFLGDSENHDAWQNWVDSDQAYDLYHNKEGKYLLIDPLSHDLTAVDDFDAWWNYDDPIQKELLDAAFTETGEINPAFYEAYAGTDPASRQLYYDYLASVTGENQEGVANDFVSQFSVRNDGVLDPDQFGYVLSQAAMLDFARDDPEQFAALYNDPYKSMSPYAASYGLGLGEVGSEYVPEVKEGETAPQPVKYQLYSGDYTPDVIAAQDLLTVNENGLYDPELYEAILSQVYTDDSGLSDIGFAPLRY